MSVEYERDPRISDVTKVRFYLGDVREGSYLVQDEEILSAITDANNNLYLAAADLADHLAARFASADLLRTGVMDVRKSAIFRHYVTLANRLRQRAISGDAFVMLTRDQSQIDTVTSDTNIPDPKFKSGMHNNDQAT